MHSPNWGKESYDVMHDLVLVILVIPSLDNREEGRLTVSLDWHVENGTNIQDPNHNINQLKDMLEHT